MGAGTDRQKEHSIIALRRRVQIFPSFTYPRTLEMPLLPLPVIFLLGTCLLASTGRCVGASSSGAASLRSLQLPKHVPANAGLATTRKVVVEFYTESLCPDCRRLTNKTLEPMFENGVAEYMDLQLIPYGNAAVQKVHQGVPAATYIGQHPGSNSLQFHTQLQQYPKPRISGAFGCFGGPVIAGFFILAATEH